MNQYITDGWQDLEILDGPRKGDFIKVDNSVIDRRGTWKVAYDFDGVDFKVAIYKVCEVRHPARSSFFVLASLELAADNEALNKLLQEKFK